MLLKADHKKVSALFKKVEALGDTSHASRGKLFAQIDAELARRSRPRKKCCTKSEFFRAEAQLRAGAGLPRRLGDVT